MRKGEPANSWGTGTGRGTHPVGDGEAILEDLVVPVALVEDVGADAASVSHGSYARAREMCVSLMSGVRVRRSVE